uniref:Uncharacterized protein n=1 Tax=Anguilla anguilla TaxID=7936 RepID=A0A0E9W420_ANGAN
MQLPQPTLFLTTFFLSSLSHQWYFPSILIGVSLL